MKPSDNNSLQVLTSDQKSRDKWIIVVKRQISFHYTNITARINNKFIGITCGTCHEGLTVNCYHEYDFHWYPTRTRNCTNQLFPNSGTRNPAVTQSIVSRCLRSIREKEKEKKKIELKMKSGNWKKKENPFAMHFAISVTAIHY